MSAYTFDCFVHNETLHTDDLQRLIAFMEGRAKCGEDE